jgi:hypothetical protein
MNAPKIDRKRILDTFPPGFPDFDKVDSQTVIPCRDELMEVLKTSPTSGLDESFSLSVRRTIYGENVHINMQSNIPKFTVKRNGQEMEVESEEIVVGDLVMIEEGNFITFDGICVSKTEGRVLIDESQMTGEVLGVSPAFGTRIWSGTTVIQGKCWVIAVFVGPHCAYGRLMYNLQPMDHPTKGKCTIM